MRKKENKTKQNKKITKERKKRRKKNDKTQFLWARVRVTYSYTRKNWIFAYGWFNPILCIHRRFLYYQASNEILLIG